MRRLLLLLAILAGCARGQMLTVIMGGTSAPLGPLGPTLVFDDFVRADGALGANWTNFPGSDCAPAIATHVVMASAGSCGHSMAYYSAASFANNHFTSFVMTHNVPGAPQSLTSPAVRATGSNLYNDVYSGTLSWHIGVIQGSTPHDFAYGTSNVTPVDGDTVELDVAGNDPVFIWSRVNGVINVGTSDSTYKLSGGAPGLGLVETATSPVAKFGAWTGGDLPAFSGTSSDNFTRADSGWLGVNWWFPWHDDEGTGWVLSSNAASVAAAGKQRWDVAAWTTPLNANHSSKITVGNLAAGDWLGPIARYTPGNDASTDNFYMAVDYSGTLTLYARVAGGWNALTTYSYTAAPGDTVELIATGVNPVLLTVKVNGSTIINAFSDGTYHIAGQYAGFASLGTSTATKVTNWTGT